MNLTFGPVKSRRFGLSLGIDLSPQYKQCNFDCLYCELKGAKPVLYTSNPPLVKDIISSVKTALLKFHDIKVITITANGEPTLYSYLKELVEELNIIKNDKKILILSNGSTIDDTNVFNALLDIDIVKLSLDSVSESNFKKVDRPHKSIVLENIIDGMKKFRTVFKNELVIEILVVKGLNDTHEEFELLNKEIQEIKPERVDISTIDRPSAYKVEHVSHEKLLELSKYILNFPVSVAKRTKDEKTFQSLDELDILSLLENRPQSEDDVENIFDENTQKIFKKLLLEKKISLVTFANLSFYKIS